MTVYSAKTDPDEPGSANKEIDVMESEPSVIDMKSVTKSNRSKPPSQNMANIEQRSKPMTYKSHNQSRTNFKIEEEPELRRDTIESNGDPNKYYSPSDEKVFNHQVRATGFSKNQNPVDLNTS